MDINNKYTYLDIVKLRDYLDESMIVSNSDPINKARVRKSDKNSGQSVFNDDGILSEKIFGIEQDMDNLDKIGWIDFKGIYVFNPIYFERLQKVFKKKKFIEMISYDKNITADGRIIDYNEEEKTASDLNQYPVKNIGLLEFKDRFLELMKEEVLDQQKSTPEYRTLIHAYLDGTLFIDCFPIFSPKLRPADVNKDTKDYRFSEVNSLYNFLVAHSNALKFEMDDSDIDFGENRLQLLNLQFEVQMDVYRLFLYIVDGMLKDKSGVIRKSIVGSRVNFSARNVISPRPKNKINEVSMNYKTFAILYETLLINLVHRIKKLPYNKSRKWVRDRQTHFDSELYSYMNELINNFEGGMKIILNRNPSISTNSIHLCTIKEVKPDFDDVTLGVSNNIIGGMGGEITITFN